MTAIDVKYAQVLPANPWIGHPITPENVCPDNVGHYRHYQGDPNHGQASIYYHPATGAHLIYGLIRQKWSQLGWERGPNGYPNTDEGEAGSNQGRYNNFQSGTVIWKVGSGQAFSVHGAIYVKWGQDGFDKGELGFPLTDETGTPDGVGRFNHFEHGSIYWTPQLGAHVVKGAIRDAWQGQGWERGALGYPLTDELVTPNTNNAGRTQRFQGGEVAWLPGQAAQIELSPGVFSIGLDAFGITNTRSRHLDTDFVTVSLVVGSRPPLTQSRALGDLNNGNFPLNMHFVNVPIAPDETAILTYNMVNNGHQDAGAVIQALEKATEMLAEQGGKAAATAIGSAIGAALGAAIGTGIVPILGTALGALAGWIVTSGFGLIFANCDGPVASGVHVLTGAQLSAAAAHGGIVVTDDHPGVDSASGCGSNSHYSVTWSAH